jgi:serine/threonine protein kinase
MRKVVRKHPDSARLAAFAGGWLDNDQARMIADHLADCVACQKDVDSLPDDPVVALLRRAASTMVNPAEAFSVSTQSESWIPKELVGHPRYKLIRWLGSGGMGVVYLAEHRLMERLVALKIISKKLTANPAAIKRFRKEVKAAAKLVHPNVVTAHDADQAGDLHFLVMEFVEGTSLARHVEERGPLSIEKACDYVCQAARGLQAAFVFRLVHRDIKPQNLMLTSGGQVKILDFGLAGFCGQEEPWAALTEYGQGLGTPDYVAPEQIRNAHTADIRADIYSLGCTLYFLLTGQTPFPQRILSEKIAAQLERVPRSPTELRTDLPKGLAAVVNRMMAKDPARRFQTPVEVVTALTGFTTGGDPNSEKRAQSIWLLSGFLAVGVLFIAIGVGLFRVFPFQDQGTESEPALVPTLRLQQSGRTAGFNQTGKTPQALEQPTIGDEKNGETRPDKKIDSTRISSPAAGDFIK